MTKCKNCGCRSNWKTGYELGKEYGVMIVNVPLSHFMSQICLCGHHISNHRGKGTDGKCLVCKTLLGFVHNFTPLNHVKDMRD